MADHIVDANKMVGMPQWDVEGNPLNLLAAAEDAYEWIHFLSIHSNKKDKRLDACVIELRKFLDEAAKNG